MRNDLSHTWRPPAPSVNVDYSCCAIVVAVNDNGNVYRVCKGCGTVVVDGGANLPGNDYGLTVPVGDSIRGH